MKILHIIKEICKDIFFFIMAPFFTLIIWTSGYFNPFRRRYIYYCGYPCFASGFFSSLLINTIIIGLLLMYIFFGIQSIYILFMVYLSFIIFSIFILIFLYIRILIDNLISKREDEHHD